MKRSIQSNSTPALRRRGVTLVEMLVTVAMLVIIMTILVQVFQAATGALSAAQSIQQIDDQLKLLDSTLRSDLAGVTAKFTPPLDPAQNLGYFEYGENDYSDVQGEDTDDYIRFTAKAPAGRPFTGRAFLPPTTSLANMTVAQQAQYLANQPVAITSEYAEIIYFLRNGNLYRRVLLVAPELQSSIVPTFNNTGYFVDAGGNLTITNTLTPAGLGGFQVSWQGANDLSARPDGTGPNINVLTGLKPATTQAGSQAQQTIILNTLGDLTNRENRFAYSRFSNDFLNLSNGNALGPDGLADDLNGDNVPDYYPTLYASLFPNAGGGPAGSIGPVDINGNPIQLVYESDYNNANNDGFVRGFTNLLGFPFVFPGAYSRNQALTGGKGLPPVDAAGWIHAPSPYALVPGNGNCAVVTFDGSPSVYLQNMNQNPIDLGDNLPTLSLLASEPLNVGKGGPTAAGLDQSWWGFPTWRETLSPLWTDPTVQVNVGPVNLAVAGTPPVGGTPIPQQPQGIVPLTPAEVSAGVVNAYSPGKTPTRTCCPPREPLPAGGTTRILLATAGATTLLAPLSFSRPPARSGSTRAGKTT